MIRVGTSGWNYRHWRDRFYPQQLPPKDWLTYYARHLGCVEINNSFYRLPSVELLQRWAEATPANFVFAVKAWQLITHRHKLHHADTVLKRFLDNLHGLGSKLGPILFQLPPRWHCNAERLAGFLSQLPYHHRYTFEFRDRSWLNNEIYELLRRHNAAFCVYQLGDLTTPFIVTADFTYIRLHGPNGPYCGSYDKPALQQWARNLAEQAGQGRDCYLFFDNDEQAYAVDNAMTFCHLLAQRGES